MNWRLAPPEIAYILNDARAEVVFIGRRFIGLLKPLMGELEHLRHVVVMDGPDDGWEGYENWVERQGDADPQYKGSPNDTVVQMYTSGTTGHPKGVQLSHKATWALDRNRSLLEERDPQLAWNDWAPDDVSLLTMPTFHISGTGWGIVGLYNGTNSIILTEFEPGQVLKIMETAGISRVVLVPAAIQMLLRHPECAKTDFSSLKFLLYGASPIPLDLLREAVAMFNCGFIQLYGMTETCGAISYLPAEDHDLSGTRRMRSAGKAITGVTIEIRDAEGKTLPPGVDGEIWIKTDSLMNGYWNLPDATAETMTNDGWVRTATADISTKTATFSCATA